MKSIRAIFTILLLAAASGTSVAQEELWSTIPRELSCPKSVVIGQTFVIKKSKTAGSQFAVQGPDGVFRVLVIAMPDPGFKSLMSDEALAVATEIKIDTKTLFATAWEVNAKSTKVFTKAGIYKFYISGNLESEEGGYVCQVKAIAAKK